MKRRRFVTISGLAGLGAMAPSGSSSAQQRAPSGRSTGPVLGCQRGPTDLRRLQHFKRHGVDHICGYPENGADPASWTVESLSALRDRCAAQGVSLDMVEFPMLSSASIDNMTPQHEMNPRLVPGLGKAIMLGKDPERQREIEFVQTIIRNCARATGRAARREGRASADGSRRRHRGGRLGAHHLFSRARRPSGH